MSLPRERAPKWRITLDEWAVIAALGLALLVRVGILQQVRW